MREISLRSPDGLIIQHPVLARCIYHITIPYDVSITILCQDMSATKQGRGRIAGVWGYRRPAGARDNIYLTRAWCCRTPAPHRVRTNLCPKADIKLVRCTGCASRLSAGGQAHCDNHRIARDSIKLNSTSLFKNRSDSLDKSH